jgi:NAD(P)-dependent dehydrogenase (short-subunit alcohol dehydrogenase family)
MKLADAVAVVTGRTGGTVFQTAPGLADQGALSDSAPPHVSHEKPAHRLGSNGTMHVPTFGFDG